MSSKSTVPLNGSGRVILSRVASGGDQLPIDRPEIWWNCTGRRQSNAGLWRTLAETAPVVAGIGSGVSGIDLPHPHQQEYET